MEGELVDDGEDVLDPLDPGQKVVAQVEALQTREAGEGPGLEVAEHAAAEVHLDQLRQGVEGSFWHRLNRVVSQYEGVDVRDIGEGGAGNLI